MHRSSPILAITILMALLNASAFAQSETEVNAAVKELVSTANTVRTYGKDANRPLRSMRRKAKDVSSVINVLRKEIRKNEPTKKAEKAQIETDCKAFVAAAQKLAGFGSGVSQHLDKAIAGDIPKADKDLLSRVDQEIYLQLAKKEIKPFLGAGTYKGMFDHLKPHRKKMLRAFTSLFINLETPGNNRGIAGEGVAQLTTDEDKEQILSEMREVLAAVDESEQTKVMAIGIMARLGDRKPFDERIKPVIQRLNDEMKKGEKANFNMIRQFHMFLADAYQRIHDYHSTARSYNIMINMVLPGNTYDKLPEQMRGQLSGQCYNFACVLSRIGQIDFGLWALEESFNYGYNNFAWAEKDGDLAELRKSDKFAGMIKGWKDGSKKPGSMAFDAEVYKVLQQELQKVMPAPKKAAEKPAGETKPAGAGTVDG